MANLKWELGVVSFHDSLEPVKQVTHLTQQYVTPTTAGNKDILVDTDVADHREAPFNLFDKQNPIPGTIGHIGPSTNTDYEGSIEPFSLSTYDNAGSNRTLTLDQGTEGHLYPLPYSTYEVGDPVVFSSMPPNWTPPTGQTLHDIGLKYFPIGRKSDFLSDSYIPAPTNTTSENSYKYINKYGLRLVLNNSSLDTNRFISAYTPVNSFNPRIPRYRIAWSQRVGLYQRKLPTPLVDTQINVRLTACDAKGDAVVKLGSNGYADDSASQQVVFVQDSSSVTQADYDWNTKYALIGGSKDLSTYTNYNGSSVGQFYFRDGVNQHYNKSKFLTSSRLKIDLCLFNGQNTTLDFDDVILEHAAGTSREYYGFYEIQDFPTEGSVTWNIRQSATSKRNVTSNNILKVNSSFGEQPPKFEVTAQYNNVKSQIYEDLRVIEEWQKRNHMVSLRTFNPSLPDVMVGFMTLSGYNNELPGLDRVSFSFKFEEA